MRSDPEMISYIAHVYHTDARLPMFRRTHKTACLRERFLDSCKGLP